MRRGVILLAFLFFVSIFIINQVEISKNTSVEVPNELSRNSEIKCLSCHYFKTQNYTLVDWHRGRGKNCEGCHGSAAFSIHDSLLNFSRKMAQS